MPATAEQLPTTISQLVHALHRLDVVAAPLQLSPLPQREWYELFTRKLQPQLGAQPFLIVAVVGGTNIGKSVIFNHLAGERLSSTSPLASGTKHPTAILNADLLKSLSPEQLFSGFQTEAWQSAEAPLQADVQHRLFYRVSPRTPKNLIILDTPDIDSVEEVNWERADYVRQCADVLIAVLTQQKYNDAAVKEFFRKAAHEGKLVIVILNQCQLPEDEEFWPLWIETFCQETGTQPHLVYLAPYDRRAAEANQLPFFERPWPLDPLTAEQLAQPHDLLTDLSRLKFDEIRAHALHGALTHIVDNQWGIPSWTSEITARAAEYREALQLMSGEQLFEVDNWPTLPNSILIAEIRDWWRHQREGWSAGVHEFYRGLGRIIALPVKLALRPSQATNSSPIERYRQQEWDAILTGVERCLQRLSWLKSLGNPLLTPRLDRILNGTARSQLIETLRRAHQEVDFAAEVQSIVDTQMRTFRDERPDAYALFRRVDSAAAAARPALSLALFVTGIGPLGEAMAPLFAETALQSALHVAGETVGSTVATAVGDKVLGDAAGHGLGYLEAKFRQLQTAFAQRRAAWIVAQLNQHLLGEFTQELLAAAAISSSEEFRTVVKLTQELKLTVQSLPST